jgi:hypothetical protein
MELFLHILNPLRPLLAAIVAWPARDADVSNLLMIKQLLGVSAAFVYVPDEYLPKD